MHRTNQDAARRRSRAFYIHGHYSSRLGPAPAFVRAGSLKLGDEIKLDGFTCTVQRVQRPDRSATGAAKTNVNVWFLGPVGRSGFRPCGSYPMQRSELVLVERFAGELAPAPAEPARSGSGAGSAVMCEHANEVPQMCPCRARCYCKSHTCKPSELDKVFADARRMLAASPDWMMTSDTRREIARLSARLSPPCRCAGPQFDPDKPCPAHGGKR